jgi:hypothetical protein
MSIAAAGNPDRKHPAIIQCLKDEITAITIFKEYA